MNIVFTVIYLLAALIVVTGFYIQSNKYLRSMVMTQAFQSLLIAIIAILLGFELKQYTFFILAILVILLRSFLVTYFLAAKIPKNKKLFIRIKVTNHLLSSCGSCIHCNFHIYSLFNIFYSYSFTHISREQYYPISSLIVLPGAFYYCLQEENYCTDTGLYRGGKFTDTHGYLYSSCSHNNREQRISGCTYTGCDFFNNQHRENRA